ncbi:MAG: hypothetical protein M0T73_08420 [Deltaproteobacteria bacterium]|nr:hypothetical protein [Deltaproteobacteria bacterium]
MRFRNDLKVLAEVLEERDPSGTRPVVIMTQDEGRFGRISDLRTCWAPKGVRPKIARQIVRTFVHVYAAVCVGLGKMKDFKDYFVIMLVNGAGWHRSGRFKIPENIRLIYQPSHSPELNPAEHLWEELR